jgi:hypothetical protein
MLMPPPQECPSRSQRRMPSARLSAPMSAASSSIDASAGLDGALDAPRPRWSYRMTCRFDGEGRQRRPEHGVVVEQAAVHADERQGTANRRAGEDGEVYSSRANGLARETRGAREGFSERDEIGVHRGWGTGMGDGVRFQWDGARERMVRGS